VVFGSGKGEILEGGDDRDWLFGGGGDDRLKGGDGANHLEGGVGDDAYEVTGDGEIDTIRDADGRGVILLDGVRLEGGVGAAGGVWKSGAIAYRLDGATLEVVKDGDVQVRVLDFKSGDLGIHLETTGLDHGVPFALSPSGYDQVLLSNDARSVSTGTLHDSATGTSQDDWVELGDGNDNALTSYGRDAVFGGEGNDYILAGPHTGEAGLEDEDRVVGGGGRDIVLGGLDDDVLHAGNEGGHLLSATSESGEFGDWVDGGDGVDTIYGGARDDVILGDGRLIDISTNYRQSFLR
jgi:Ca2+-binding RTX toxin-like protein